MPVLPAPINLREPPRHVFTVHAKVFGDALPIRGGWGYALDEAVIIDMEDEIVAEGLPFDGVGVEYAFVEKRIYAEMVLFRSPGEGFAGIDKRLLVQNLISEGARYYDLLQFEIKAFSERDWGILKSSGNLLPEEYYRREAEMIVRFRRDFWFEITSFYGKQRCLG